MGAAVSTSTSEQIGNQNLSQSLFSSCNISCNNTMKDTGITVIRSNTGDITIAQTCAVNGQCVFSSVMASVADLQFKAANAAQAAATAVNFGTYSFTGTYSYQEINQNIQQSTSQKCNISSSNDMNNVQAYIADSKTGNISIDQNASAGGTCVLKNAMNADASGTGVADNCAASGKAAKKKSCKGKGGGIGSYILYFIVGIIGFTIVMTIIRFLKGNAPKLPPCTKENKEKNIPCDPKIKLQPCTEKNKGQPCEEIEAVPLTAKSGTPRAVTTEFEFPFEKSALKSPLKSPLGEELQPAPVASEA